MKYMTIGSLIVALRFGDWHIDIRHKLPIVLETPDGQRGAKRIRIGSLREYVGQLIFWAEKGSRQLKELFNE
jgi:hypothetical protein